jgi:choline dehydrogenase-like flavoprotein
MSHSTTNDRNVDYDVVIAGGGPSGSTTAARLATYGYRVLLLEEKVFPRFHIGESLLIGARTFLKELGLLEEMDRRFLKKYGGTYIWGKGKGPDDLDYWEIYWAEEIPFLTEHVLGHSGRPRVVRRVVAQARPNLWRNRYRGRASLIRRHRGRRGRASDMDRGDGSNTHRHSAISSTRPARRPSSRPNSAGRVHEQLRHRHPRSVRALWPLSGPPGEPSS